MTRLGRQVAAIGILSLFVSLIFIAAGGHGSPSAAQAADPVCTSGFEAARERIVLRWDEARIQADGVLVVLVNGEPFFLEEPQVSSAGAELATDSGLPGEARFEIVTAVDFSFFEPENLVVTSRFDCGVLTPPAVTPRCSDVELFLRDGGPKAEARVTGFNQFVGLIRNGERIATIEKTGPIAARRLFADFTDPLPGPGTYTYEVVGLSQAGVASPPEACGTVTTDAGPFERVAACNVNISDGVPRLVWDVAEGAAEYLVWRNGFIVERLDAGTNTGSFSDPNPPTDRVLHYSVSSANGSVRFSRTYCGSVSISDGGLLLVDTCDVSFPARNPFASGASDGPLLRWPTSPGAQSYDIWRNGRVVDTIAVRPGPTQTFVDSNPPQARTLHYSVAPRSGDRTQSRTYCGSVVVPDTERPTVPAARVRQDGSMITWGESTDNIGVVGYEITYADAGKTRFSTTTSAQVEFSGRVFVKAKDAAGNLSWRTGFTNVRLN